MRPPVFRRLSALARSLAASCAIGAAFVSTSAHAYVVNEFGDAGQTQATAQSTVGGSGSLTDIFGSLLSPTDADLYVVDITNPATFSATTDNSVGGALDSQIFLLTLAGAPIYFNDDANGFSLLSTLPAGNALRPTVAGRYLLGVAASGYNPVNAANQLLFATLAQSYLPTDVAGPAFGLQPAVLGGFTDQTYDPGEFGPYDLRLTGVNDPVASVPEPSTGGLMLAGGMLVAAFGLRRRAAARHSGA